MIFSSAECIFYLLLISCYWALIYFLSISSPALSVWSSYDPWYLFFSSCSVLDVYIYFFFHSWFCAKPFSLCHRFKLHPSQQDHLWPFVNKCIYERQRERKQSANTIYHFFFYLFMCFLLYIFRLCFVDGYMCEFSDHLYSCRGCILEVFCWSCSRCFYSQSVYSCCAAVPFIVCVGGSACRPFPSYIFFFCVYAFVVRMREEFCVLFTVA